MKQVAKKEHEFKIAIIGSMSVGKSSIAIRFAKSVYSKSIETTIGVSFLSCYAKTEIGTATLRIWDTGGSEKYRSLAPMYYRDADYIIIVYDITVEHSLVEAGQWIEQVKKDCPENCHFCLVGNKLDLKDKRFDADDLINEYELKYKFDFYIETSAQTDKNINDLFTRVARICLQVEQKGSNGEIDIGEDTPAPPSCC